MVQIRSRPFITKYILPVIGAEGSAIFPLGVANSIIVPDRNPTTLENRLTIAHEGLFEPGNHVLSLWFSVPALYIVVRQSEVKRVLSREKAHRHKLLPHTEIGIIVPAIIDRPIRVPRTGVVWNRIFSGWTFSNPENGGHDAESPRIATRFTINPAHSAAQRCSYERLTNSRRRLFGRFYLFLTLHDQQAAFPQLYRILGKVGTTLILRLSETRPGAEAIQTDRKANSKPSRHECRSIARESRRWRRE